MAASSSAIRFSKSAFSFWSRSAFEFFFARSKIALAVAVALTARS